MEEKGKTRCCPNCTAPYAGDFKKVVDLQYSGLVIYIHTKKDDQKKAGASKYDDTYILHNTGSKHIKRPEYISELNRFKTKCAQCKTIVQRVRSLLEESKAINVNEVIGVCKHCKRATGINKTCKRCNFIVDEFISMNEKRCEEKQQRFNLWICKVKKLLQAILNEERVCHHREYKDTELERMLNALIEPSRMRELEIDVFPSLDQDKLTEGTEILEELLSKINVEGEKHFSSDEFLRPSPSNEMCLCKYLKEKFKGEILDLSSGKQKEFKDISREPLEDLSKLLSKQEYESLIRRLLDLSKALPQEHYLNKELILKIVQTINVAVNQNLPKNVVLKLINELTELNKTLTHDLSKDLNTEVTERLIYELNDLLAMASSKDRAISSGDASKALSQGLSKDKSDKTEQGLLNSQKGISKDISSKFSSSKYSKGETSFKSAKHGDLIESASKEDKAKKKTKSERTSSKKASSMDRTSKKTREDIDASDDTEKKKKKVKIPKDIKGKENLQPRNGKMTKNLKSKSKQKLQQTRQLSQSLLLKMLQNNQTKAERINLYKQKQLQEQTDMEKKRLKELSMKGLKKIQKKILRPAPKAVETESILECGIQKTVVPNVMIRGDKIIPYSSSYKDIESRESKLPEPLLFETQIEIADNTIPIPKMSYQKNVDKETFRDSIIRYQLSDKEFITKGWTTLPTKKIMRRMNVYRMMPSNPQNCWFERHKGEGQLFYNTGEKLAEVDNNSQGHWYYRNGTIALDYYNARESNVGRRCVVYSSGTEMEFGKIKPRTILALFDFLGNCVVYDHYGKVRLKYNQSEGLLVDSKIGPPGKWKWHSLNDPPVLQQEFRDTYSKERDPRLDQIQKPAKCQDANDFVKVAHPEMLAIELDNFVKEKTSKLAQKFRPFQIRMKAVKLNEQFALKIIDQTNIHLLYRDGFTNLKLNLGMLLVNNEIIDTVISDRPDVATPYDENPSEQKSESVENIQKLLKAVRSGKRPTLEYTVNFSNSS